MPSARLRQRMIEDMNSRKLGPHSQRGHIYSCKRLAAFLKRSPETATCEARVEHPEARRMSAFSVGMRIVECEVHDADSAHFHGVLKRVELSEVSITDRPCNSRAIVEQRIPAAISDFYSFMQLRVQCAAKYLQLVGQHYAA